MTKSDNEALHQIVDGNVDFDDESAHRVEQNYRFFTRQLGGLNDEALGHIYKGLQKLIIVDIALDKDKDDPQLIFESLNSTGLALSQADLIRNYVLMKQDIKEQNRLYKDYWFPMEENFGHGEYSTRFNAFMRDFLTLRTGYTPRKDEVYEGFKAYVNKSADSIQDIVAEVYRYSSYYVAFTLEAEKEPALKEAFRDLNSYKVDVAYPLVLELYNDYDHKVLTLGEFEECVRFIESYAFRRLVCWIPTNSMNKTFARFSRDLKKDRYVESFKAAFLLLTGNRRMPLDNEFKQHLQTKDMYNMRNKAYWLRKLENYHHKEPIHVAEYTVDVVPRATGIRLILNMKFDQIHDPENRCRDITNIGHMGNGDVRVKLDNLLELDYVMELVQQALDLQVGE